MVETRNTNQRMKILEYLKSVCSHPTAEDVYNHVKKDMPAITLATVYRNLNLLAEKGEILRMEINKEYHYDFKCMDHLHLVCERCGKIFDIENKKVTDYAKNNIVNEFNVKTVSILIRGICKKCEDDKNGKQKN